MAKPRILFFAPYDLDAVDTGGARRCHQFWQIIQGIADVRTIMHAPRMPATRNPDAAVVRVPLQSSRQRLYHKALLDVVDHVCVAWKPNLLWAEHFYSTAQLAYRAHRHGIALVCNTQNVEVRRFEDQGLLMRMFIRRYEKHLLKASDHVLCVSEMDRQGFREEYGIALESDTVLRNGFDEIQFRPSEDRLVLRKSLLPHAGLDPERPLVLYCGGYDYPPNRQALAFIESSYGPALNKSVPEAQIALVGRALDREGKRDNIHYVGRVADIVPWLQASDLLVCPLLSGGGSRLKIIESLACGLPVLSSDKGAEGLDDLGERDGLYRAPMEALAGCTAVWLNDGIPACPRAEEGPLKAYSNGVIASQTQRILERIIVRA